MSHGAGGFTGLCFKPDKAVILLIGNRIIGQGKCTPSIHRS